MYDHEGDDREVGTGDAFERVNRNGRRRRKGAGEMNLGALESRLLYTGAGDQDDDVLHTDFPAAMDPVAIQATHDAQAGAIGGALVPVSGGVPAFNSNAGAAARLIIDFDGAAAMTWGTYNVPSTPAYDQDGDPTTFNAAELASINEIVMRVAEKFSPFNVNVTTVDDGGPYLNKQAVRVLVGGTGTWVGAVTGGLAYIGGFYNSADNTAFAFPGNLSNGYAKYTAEAVAHEAGHSFGLQHQAVWTGSTLTHEYNPGTSATAPVMGVSYYATRGLWWTGTPSNNSAGTQADLTTLTNSNNGFGFRNDDHGGTTGTASTLSVLGNNTFTASGVVSQNTDADYFAVTMGAGKLTVTLGVAQYGAMLDGSLFVYDSNGTLVASAATSSLGETLAVDLAGGTYYVAVASSGGYGDIGQYSLAGSIVPAVGPVTTPTGVTASAITDTKVRVTWSDQSNNEAGFVVEKSFDGSFWFDLGAVGPNVTTFDDDTTTGSTTYYYRVRGFNGDGESASSVTASVTTMPAAPAGLSVTLSSATQADLSWSGVDGATGYLVERSLDGSTWSQVAARAAGVTTYSDAGLSGGTRYYYRVRATSAAGNSAYSATGQVLTLPGTPAGLAGSASSANQVGLSWTAVTGATSYEVERSTDGSTWSAIGTSLTAAYTDTGLSGGTHYFYRVRAVNATGASGYASPVDVLTLPTTPTLQTVTATSTTEITVTWSGVTGATSYSIDRSTDGTNWSAAGTTAGTSFGDSGLSAGTRYYYRVRAVNGSGNSANSATLNAYTLPAAPATLTATATSATQVALSWSAVTGATSYAVERSTDGTTWSALTTTASVSHNDTTASGGTTYHYRVRAVNASGNSAYGPTKTALTLPAAPGTPTATVTATSVTLTWTAVTGAASYSVERSISGVWTVVGTPTSATFTETELASGTAHSYRVRAVNATGNSGYSGTRSATTLPAAPGSFTAAAASTTQITLSWTAVTGATSYVLDRSTNNSTWTQVTSTTSTSFSNTGLTAGTGYYYRIRATNASGSSAYATSGMTYTLPVAPTGLAVTASSNQVTLTWTAVAGAAGYSVERSLDGSTWAVAGTPAGATYTDTGLTANTQYYYRVRATNASGNSAYSSTAGAMTAPAAPGSTTATPVSATRVDLSWGAAVGATSYAVERSTNGTTWAALTTTTSTTYADTTVAGGTQYYYRVRSINAGGSSANGPTAAALTVPAAPAGLSVVSTSSTAVTLTWTGVTGATGYEVDRSADGVAWTSVGTTTDTTVGDTGLSAGAVYYYRVRALNQTGGSAYVAGTNASTPPATPAGLAVSGVSSTTVSLSWTASVSTTTYTVQRSVNGTTWATVGTTIVGVTTFTDATASALTQYYYRVTASNPIGSSTPSGAVQTTTAPAAPASVSVNAGVAGKVTLTWATVTGATSYAVERSADGASWANVQTTSGTSVEDPNVQPGTTYWYRVRATGASGTSDYSQHGVAVTIPAVPAGVTAEPQGAGTVSLAWDAVAGATSYRVERSADGTNWSLVSTTAATSISDTGVSGGTAYSYRVASINASGMSAYATPVGALTAPDAPTGLAGVSAVGTSVTLTWSPVTGAQSYSIERSLAGSGQWEVVGTAVSATFADETVTYLTAYSYRVRAINPSGASGYSGTANVTTAAPPIVISTPTTVAISEVGSGSVTVDWSDNSNNEEGFLVQRSANGGLSWVTVGQTVADVTSYVDSTVSGGTAYLYRVQGFNGVFRSDASDAAAVTTKPSAPAGLAVATVSLNRLGLSWSAVTGATSYEVQRSSDGETDWETVATVNGTSHEDTQLDAGTRQYYRVRAVGQAGESAYSGVANNVTLPTAPAYLVAMATPDGSVALGWSPVTGGQAYLIERSEDGVNWSQLVTTSELVHVDWSVSAGTVYYYRAIALGEAGPSGKTLSEGVLTAPAAPADPAALPVAPGEINVSWSPVTGASSYVLERSADGVTWETVGTTELNSFTDAGLLPNARYFYRARAVNATGESGLSAVVEAATFQTAPEAPSSLAVSVVSANTLRLNWEGSTNETGYRVEYSQDGGKTWKLAGNLAAGGKAVQVTGLITGDNYRFRVAAYNEMGLSKYSGTISGKALGGKLGTQPGTRVLDVRNVRPVMPGLPKKLAPAAVKGVTARAYSSSAVQLTWTDRSDNELGFRVEYSLDGKTWRLAGYTAADQTGARVTSLQKGTAYFFRVTAYNLAGDAKGVTAKATVPTVPPKGPSAKPSRDPDQDTVLNVLNVKDSAPGVSPVTKAIQRAVAQLRRR